MNKYCVVLLLLLLMGSFISCQSKEKLDKTKNQEGVSVPQKPTMKRTLNFNYPISTDFYVLSGEFSVMYGRIRNEIKSYPRVTGTYPNSMTEYINSGFPLTWSRNVLDGSIVRPVSKEHLILERSDSSHFIWEKKDDSHAQFKYIFPDGEKFRNFGTESWVETVVDLEFGMRDPLDPAIKGRLNYAYSYDNAITIPGGTKVINHINDPEIRWLYALCGQLVRYVDSRTLHYHFLTHSLPLNFADLIHPSNLFIKDNLLKLADILNSKNVDFKVGFDYDKSTLYSVLWVNGEKYIYYCANFEGSGNQDYYVPYTEGEFHSCNMNEINMSSPMISSIDFVSFIQSIPEDVFISIKDILNE